MVLLEAEYRPIRVRDPRPMGRQASIADTSVDGIGRTEIRMSWKPKFNWKPALFSLAALATLVLAAGARYKPH